MKYILILVVLFCSISSFAQNEPMHDSMQVMSNDFTAVYDITKTMGKVNTDVWYEKSLEHRNNVFEWQYKSSIIIFVMVITIVLFGLIFSGIQFFKSTKQPNSELELSTSGIKVSTSILGVILLIISLAFFYLYLIHVYPISIL